MKKLLLTVIYLTVFIDTTQARVESDHNKYQYHTGTDKTCKNVEFNGFTVDRITNNVYTSNWTVIAHNSVSYIYRIDRSGVCKKLMLLKGKNFANSSNQLLAVDSKRKFIYYTAGDQIGTDEHLFIVKFNLLSGKFIQQIKLPVMFSNVHDLSSMELDTSGNIYLLNKEESVIYKYSPSGHLLLTWGGVGAYDSKFKEPESLAIDKYNYIYVADSGNHRIQKFDSTGHFITKWGSAWDGDVYADYAIDEFTTNMGGIGVDNDINVYVNDGNRKIKKFYRNGDLISSVPPKISSPYFSANRSHIQVDTSGNIYFLERGELIKFNKNLHLLDGWGKTYTGASGYNRGRYKNIVDIVFDSQNNMYVLDTMKCSIQKISKYGKFIRQWGEKGDAKGQFHWVNSKLSMAINNFDEIYVLDSGYDAYHSEQFPSRIHRFNKDGKLLQTILLPLKDDGTYVESIAIDKDNNIYIPHVNWFISNYHKYYKIIIYVYNRYGEKIREIEFSENFSNSGEVDIDKKRNILYVKGGSTVLKCTLSGKILTGWETENGNQIVFKDGRWGYVHDKTLSIYSNSGTLIKHEDLLFSSSLATEDNFGNVYLSNKGNERLEDNHRWIYKKLTSPDVDHDGVINEKDAFPFNRYEWVDTDHDGVGNNADKDDDNDGLSDVIEKAHKLNPLKASDALADFDHDGFSNIMEINAGTNIRSAKSHPIWTPIIMGNIITFIPSHK